MCGHTAVCKLQVVIPSLVQALFGGHRKGTTMADAPELWITLRETLSAVGNRDLF